MTMLYRCAGTPALDGSVTPSALNNAFRDAASVEPYAQTAMLWAVERNILSGTADGRLAPQDSATRAQVAAIMARFLCQL